MTYLTKTKFTEEALKLEKIKAGSSNPRLKLWGEGRINFIDMEPGIIYLKTTDSYGNRGVYQYFTLADSKENRDWVGLYDSTTILHTSPSELPSCEFFIIYVNNIRETISISNTVRAALTFPERGVGNVLNGWASHLLQIYELPVNLIGKFINWSIDNNPLEK